MPRDGRLVADLKKLLKRLNDEHNGNEGGKGLLSETGDQRDEGRGIGGDEEDKEKGRK